MSYLLSLDLGVQSVGWGIIQNGQIHRLGVRCFDSGTGTADDISKGKDESRNTARRMARAVRTQFQRRSQRAAGIAAVLQNAGLLPLRDQRENPYNVRHPEERDKLFKELDWELTADFINDGDRVNGHLLPYLLRAYALKKTLPNFALGRALFHLGQRRGYLSNRKTVDLDEQDDEQGKVLGGIAALTEQIQNAGCTTLGEYFSTLDPEQQRIRQRYTSRQMFIDEFNAIWKSQAPHNPLLTDDLYDKIYRAIFFQRPLKSMRNKLGKCELVPDKRRAPIACMEFQRFRYWQKILDLAYLLPGDDWQYLSEEQTRKLANAFEENEALSFTDIRDLFNWKRSVKINLAEGGAKKIKGNVTAARLRKAIPLRWQSMDDPQKDALVAEILQFEHEDALARRLIKVFGFSTTEAETVAHTYLENGWASLSKAAIKQLLPYMIDNQEPFATAVKSLFNVQKQQDTVYDRLPALTRIVGSIRNPIVERALSEMRKVVNAVIRYAKANGLSPDGKPDQIVIELARDMKKSRKQRENDFKLNRENETKREAARNKIIKEAGIANPKGGDILKVILADECSWECPYTGKTITMNNLFGPSPEFDIEHILPFSRSLDNSFNNKTLCEVYYNRHVKKNRTPYECASQDPQTYHDMLERVKRFKGNTSKGPSPKMRRFQMETIPTDFSSRMLNDTRYISRIACDYLGCLWGGQIDRSDSNDDSSVGTRRIFVCTGQATAWLRGEWSLNSVLNDGSVDEKERTDHRHHAVDAAAIAYCSPKIVILLASAAEQAEERDDQRRLFLRGAVPPPYEGYLDDVKEKISRIKVSYRCNKKVSGALHKETNYSKPHWENDPKTNKPVEYRYLRKPLASLSVADIDNIVDPVVRRIVQDKLARLDNKPKAFENPNELPYRIIRSQDGSERLVPIKKVRFKQKLALREIGSGVNQRFVATGGNHHMEVYAQLDKNGRETKWIAETVTMFDVYQRRKNKQPIINRDHGPDTLYKFTVFKNEFFELTNADGSVTLKRVFKLSGQVIGWGDHNDARPANDVTNGTPGNRPTVNSLKGRVQKVSVDLLGDIHPAND